MRYKTDTNATSFSKGEVLANSITHGIGVGLSIAGIVILIIRAIDQGTKWHLRKRLSSIFKKQPPFLEKRLWQSYTDASNRAQPGYNISKQVNS